MRRSPADGPRRQQSDAVFLYHQPYPPIRLAERFRMRQNHRPYLLFGNRRLIPTLEEAAFIDFTGDLASLHAMSGAGKEEYYGFFEFHYKLNGSQPIIFMVIVEIVARILISNRFLPIKRVITTFFCGFSFSI